MLVVSRSPSRIALIQIFRRAFPPVSHGTPPPRDKKIHTYIHIYRQTDKQTNNQTNKHRKRQSAVWPRPCVFNKGQQIGHCVVKIISELFCIQLTVLFFQFSRRRSLLLLSNQDIVNSSHSDGNTLYSGKALGNIVILDVLF